MTLTQLEQAFSDAAELGAKPGLMVMHPEQAFDLCMERDITALNAFAKRHNVELRLVHNCPRNEILIADAPNSIELVPLHASK